MSVLDFLDCLTFKEELLVIKNLYRLEEPEFNIFLGPVVENLFLLGRTRKERLLLGLNFTEKSFTEKSPVIILPICGESMDLKDFFDLLNECSRKISIAPLVKALKSRHRQKIYNVNRQRMMKILTKAAGNEFVDFLQELYYLLESQEIWFSNNLDNKRKAFMKAVEILGKPQVIKQPEVGESLEFCRRYREWCRNQGIFSVESGFLKDIPLEMAIYICWISNYLIKVYGLENYAEGVVNLSECEDIILKRKAWYLPSRTQLLGGGMQGLDYESPAPLFRSFLKKIGGEK